MRKKISGVLLVGTLITGWLGFTAPPAASAGTTGFTVDAGGTNNGKLYTVDLTNGALSEIGSTGENDIEGLSFACDGTLYGINRAGAAAQGARAGTQGNELVTINTTTGAVTVVGSLSVEPADAGLTFGIDGKLYMAEVNTGEFYEVNKTTAAVRDIGPLGDGFEISGLATRADGAIFGFDRNSSQLVTINPATGAAAVVGSQATTPRLNLIGLDFDAGGTLWGISGTNTNDGNIVTFNTTTGADTVVSTYDKEIHAFVSLAITGECAPPPPPPPPPPAPPAPAVEAAAQLTG